MPQYIRAHIAGGSFFFTVTLIEHVDLLRAAFRNVRLRRPFQIDAIVVLPDHLHCIWTLPPDDADFSTRQRLIKTTFVCGIAAGERLSARRQRASERGIWQRRFWEHAIRDENDFVRHVDYIHYNRSSTPTWIGLRIGRIRISTVMWRGGCVPPIRRLRRTFVSWIWSNVLRLDWWNTLRYFALLELAGFGLPR